MLIGALWLSAPLPAADRTTERQQFRAAFAAASRAPDDLWKKLAATLDPRYPLTPYIELAALRQRIKEVSRSEVERYLARWPDTLPASDLRDAYLRELARREDWPTFRALWKNSSERDLQCDELQARIAAGERLDYSRDLDALWSGTPALPQACATVIRAARASGALADTHVWERLDRSAAAGNADVAANAAALLGGAERATADRIVAALRDPAATFALAKNWADEPRARDAIAWGLARYARRSSAAAETAWSDLEGRFKWDVAQKNRVLNALALYRATSYSPDALARLQALPANADDDATREWRVRIALVLSNFKEALAALERMPAAQAADPRWRYLRARLLEKLNQPDAAAPLLATLAQETNFYGFLAADWTERPYSICPAKLASDPAIEKMLAKQSDLARAFEFRELDMLPEARREWAFAMSRLDEKARRLAADLATRRGWYDRAVFAYSADPATQHLYEQRFPLGMENEVKRESHTAGIDPAWTYAIIRAESAWMTDAHSGADAYGLMQLLPAVAKQVAKAENLPYGNAQDLFNPALNVQLGTRFLGRMADKYQGSPWLASAAYNAGEAPVGRWLDARPSLDPDFFIETIPYKETREYVSRVLAFSVIYDWRMHGNALALSARMPRIGQAYRAPDTTTARKNVVCAASTALEKAPQADTIPAPAAPAQVK